MPSPFPGMDPYIEQHRLWPDFHDDLIGEIKRRLAAAVPERYVVRTGERLIEERYRENFIEIYDTQAEQRLVTTLEVLSPANKRRGTEGWDLYLRKRQALLLGAANLVEIDLLRGGQRLPMVTPWPASPYYLLVCRKQRAPYCTVWPASFQEPLPEVLVPLDDPDPDVCLALQPMVEAIYRRSRYDTSIDYAKPLTPPLTPAQAGWLGERLRPGSLTRPGTARRRKRT